jgi:hypothetical protein
MLKIKQPVIGVYELDITDTSMLNKTVVVETSNSLLHNPFDELVKNTKTVHSLNLDKEEPEEEPEEEPFEIKSTPGLFSFHRKNRKQVVVPDVKTINEMLVNIDKTVRDSLVKNPLLLLNECMSKCCPLTRTKQQGMRYFIELMLINPIKTSNSVCFVGIGGMFQELLVLTQNKTSDTTVFLVDNLCDYIDCCVQDTDREEFVVDSTKYYGAMDANTVDRAKWACIKTLRYLSFINWFKSLGYNLNIILCDGWAAYGSAMQYYTNDIKPKYIIGIDLIDDFAEAQLTAFYKTALLSKVVNEKSPRGVLVSKGLIHIFDVVVDPDIYITKEDEEVLDRMLDITDNKNEIDRVVNSIEHPKFWEYTTNEFEMPESEFDKLINQVDAKTKTLVKYQGRISYMYVLNLLKGTYKLLSRKNQRTILSRLCGASVVLCLVVGLIGYGMYKLVY